MLCQIILTSLCLTSANAQPNVVEIAANSQEFTTLVAAVTAADLATTLTSEGPFTIFAPSNSAFGRIDGSPWPGLGQRAESAPAFVRCMAISIYSH